MRVPPRCRKNRRSRRNAGVSTGRNGPDYRPTWMSVGYRGCCGRDDTLNKTKGQEQCDSFGELDNHPLFRLAPACANGKLVVGAKVPLPPSLSLATILIFPAGTNVLISGNFTRLYAAWKRPFTSADLLLRAAQHRCSTTFDLRVRRPIGASLTSARGRTGGLQFDVPILIF